MERQPDYGAELQDKIEDMSTRENRIRRYRSLYPHLVNSLVQDQSVNEAEAVYCIYCSEEIQTSTEIQEVDEEERINLIIKSLVQGRDNFNLDFDTQLLIMELIYTSRKKIVNQFRYDTDRGYPRDVVMTSIVVNRLYPIFEELQELSDISITWLTAQIVGVMHGSTAAEVITQYNLEKTNDILTPENAYKLGKQVVDLLELQIDQPEAISTTTFEAEISGSIALLWYIKDDKQFIYPSRFSKDKDDLNLMDTCFDAIFSLITNPLLEDEDGPSPLKFFQCTIQTATSYNDSQEFLIQCQQEGANLGFLLDSPSSTDINLTLIYNFLNTHISMLNNQDVDDEIISTYLSEWSNFLLVSSISPEFLQELAVKDTMRDRDWSFHSLIYTDDIYKKGEVDYISKSEDQIQVKDSQIHMIEYCKAIHTIHQMLIQKNQDFVCLPKALMSGNKGASYYFRIYNIDSYGYASMLLQDRPQKSEFKHIHSDHLNLKYIKMKLTEISKLEERDYLKWLKDRVGIRIDNHVINSDELPLIESELIAIEQEKGVQDTPTTSLVAKRLERLQQTSDAKNQLQTYIFDFIQQSIKEYMMINLLHQKKVSDFINEEFKFRRIREAEERIDALIDEFQIYKIPGGIGSRAIEIVKTFETLVSRNMQQALFKISNLGQHISKMAPDHVESILRQLDLDEMK